MIEYKYPPSVPTTGWYYKANYYRTWVGPYLTREEGLEKATDDFNNIFVFDH